MWWKGHSPVFGCSDPKHIQKAWPRSLRASSRTMQIFKFHVHLSPLILNGIPRQSIAGKDVHADKEAAKVLNPRHLAVPHFDDIGMQDL